MFLFDPCNGQLSLLPDLLSWIYSANAAFVYSPEYRGVEFSFQLMIEVGYNIDSLQNDVRTKIINYINNIPIGGTIIWNQIVSIIVNTDGVKDFMTDYFKIGEYDAFNKINKKQKVLRTINQRSYDTEKFYTDKGLCKICCKQV